MSAIPTAFNQPIFTCVLLMIECAMFSFPVMSQRKKHFSEDFLNKNFGEVSKKELGVLPAKLGYPDTGSGRYSKKLGLDAWIEFNKSMRAHLNFVEMIPVFIFFILLAAFFDPTAATYCGYGIFVARLLHLIGYKIHPDFRSVGSMSTFGLLGYLLFVSATGLAQQ